MSFALTQQDVAFFSYASLINYSHCADIWCKNGGKLTDDPRRATRLFACDTMDALSSSVISSHPTSSPPQPGIENGERIRYEPVAIYHPEWIQVSQQHGAFEPLEPFQIPATLPTASSSPPLLDRSSRELSSSRSQLPKVEEEEESGSGAALDSGKAPLPLQLGKRTRGRSTSVDSDDSEVEELLRFASEEPVPASSVEVPASNEVQVPVKAPSKSRQAASATPMSLEFVDIPVRSTPASRASVEQRIYPPPPPPTRQPSVSAGPSERRTSARLESKPENEGAGRRSTLGSGRKRLFKKPLRPMTEQESAGPSRYSDIIDGLPTRSSSVKNEE